jgi:hypothetical protein
MVRIRSLHRRVHCEPDFLDQGQTRLIDGARGIEHRQHKGLNNRAENSHEPTRRRERQMKQFKSAGQAQRFLSARDQINSLFYLRRDHLTAAEHRAARTQTFRVWAEIGSIAAMMYQQHCRHDVNAPPPLPSQPTDHSRQVDGVVRIRRQIFVDFTGTYVLYRYGGSWHDATC